MQNAQMAVLRELLSICSEAFQQMPRYVMGDNVISWSVSTFPENIDYKQVLIKVVLLNTLYKTAIFDVYKITEHIINQEIDTKIRRGDLGVIETIRRGHGIGNNMDLYSFATKYVHWHNTKQYPIFDNLVDKLLPEIEDRYMLRELYNGADRNYPSLKAAIDEIVSLTGLQEFKYKKIDQALWVYAKYKYKSKELPMEIVDKIKKIEEMGK
jgi:hypothetical protein